MALSAFDDKTHEPASNELTEVLGPTAVLWESLISKIESSFDPLEQDWGFSGKKWGWALRLKHKKRSVLYMTPSNGFFLAGFALGQRALDAARQSGLSRSVLEHIDGAQKYAEGRAVRLEVRSPEDVNDVAAVAHIKMTN
jgi:hypothetical protein